MSLSSHLHQLFKLNHDPAKRPKRVIVLAKGTNCISSSSSSSDSINSHYRNDTSVFLLFFIALINNLILISSSSSSSSSSSLSSSFSLPSASASSLVSPPSSSGSSSSSTLFSFSFTAVRLLFAVLRDWTPLPFKHNTTDCFCMCFVKQGGGSHVF